MHNGVLVQDDMALLGRTPPLNNEGRVLTEAFEPGVLPAGADQVGGGAASGAARCTLAPGFEYGGERYQAAVELSRITFVYILFISLVALHGGVLNSHLLPGDRGCVSSEAHATTKFPPSPPAR